jgi:hypothetical protein
MRQEATIVADKRLNFSQEEALLWGVLIPSPRAPQIKVSPCVK